MMKRLMKQSLISATLMTVGGNILGRLFGFFREAVIASYFGTTALLDLFILAFTIPEIIGTVLFQAMPSSLIPALARRSEESKNDREAEGNLFWSGLVWFALIFFALGVIVFLLREPILRQLSGTLSSEHIALGKRLIAILSIFIFLRGLEAYFRSWCFARKHFAAPAVGNILTNVGIIGSVYFLFDILHIETLAWGWTVGALLLTISNGIFAFVVVKPGLPRIARSPWVTAVARSVVIIAGVELISMVYPLIDRYLAAQYLGPGPISALRYAATMITIPAGVFVAGFNLAAFPWISDYSSGNNNERLLGMYTGSIRMLVLFMSLVGVGIAIFSTDIVKVVLERGAFDETSLELTASPMAVYCIGIVFHAVHSFQMRFYYAHQYLKRLAYILVSGLAIKSLLSVILIHYLDHEGLALATAAAWTLNCVIMTLDLEFRFKLTALKETGRIALPMLPMLAIVVGYWYLLGLLWPIEPGLSTVVRFARLMVMGGSGLALYLVLAKLFRLPEARRVWKLVTRQKNTTWSNE